MPSLSPGVKIALSSNPRCRGRLWHERERHEVQPRVVDDEGSSQGFLQRGQFPGVGVLADCGARL